MRYADYALRWAREAEPTLDRVSCLEKQSRRKENCGTGGKKKKKKKTCPATTTTNDPPSALGHGPQLSAGLLALGSFLLLLFV